MSTPILTPTLPIASSSRSAIIKIFGDKENMLQLCRVGKTKTERQHVLTCTATFPVTTPGSENNDLVVK